MIDRESLLLTKLKKVDLDTLMDWAQKEGWNPGKNDTDVFWETDPDGYYGFFYNQKLIAGGAVISYHREFGFMGLFIVHPDFRRQGLGKKLWYLRRDLLLSRLSQNAAIGMDGVVAMQPFYERGGFQKAFRDERYEIFGKKLKFSENISAVVSEDFNMLLAYDTLCLGYERKAFLENWVAMPQSKAFKFIENNQVMGYALIRKVIVGYKIGPLFANDPDIAEELFKSCLNEAAENPVYLDIPTINEGAVELVNQYGGKYVFECARMYYGKAPSMAIHKVFGITTFELG